jgi:hypothetical protein
VHWHIGQFNLNIDLLIQFSTRYHTVPVDQREAPVPVLLLAQPAANEIVAKWEPMTTILAPENMDQCLHVLHDRHSNAKNHHKVYYPNTLVYSKIPTTHGLNT